MQNRQLTVAWISYFPIEWLDGLPERLISLPRQHPASWQRVLAGELEGYREIRLHIVVLRKHFVRSESFERNGVTFHLVKTIGGARAPSLFWLDTLLIRRVLKHVQPDLVHAWGTESGAGMVASRLRYPYVLTVQGLLTWVAATVPLDRYHQFTAMFEDRSLRRASVVTAESVFAVQYLRNRHPHLELHQIEHSPLRLFHEVIRKPQLEPLRFLFVGSFSFLKGGDTLLLAMDRLQSDWDFELICVGSVDAGFVASLKTKVSSKLWAKVQFLGSLKAEQIAAELSKAAMLIYPTRCDNSPNAVKEAVVAGVPVVATNVGGIVDYVVPGLNGLLFAPGDADACHACLSEGVRHPLFSRGVVEAGALNKVRSYLSATTMAQRFVDLYKLVDSRRTRSD